MPASARRRSDRDGEWYVFYRVGKKRWNRRVGPHPESETRARLIAEHFNAGLEDRREREAMLGTGGPAPFDVVATAWWETKEPAMPASTRTSKRCVVFDRLIPYWGDRDIRRIDADAVRACAVHWIRERDHARETVETTGSALASILAWAVDKGHVAECPALSGDRRRRPRAVFREVAAARARPRARIEAWTREEAGHLVELARKRGHWLGDPVLFVAQTGCRRGEMIALEWRDVDLIRRQVKLRQSESRGQLKTTKADKERDVVLSKSALEMLERRSKSSRSGRVFRDPQSKPWADYKFHGYWVRLRREAVKRHGVRPFKFHCFRHSWATWALAAGHDPGWAAGQIGDTIEVFLRRYSHAMPGVERSLDFLDLTPTHAAGPPPESAGAPDRPAAGSASGPPKPPAPPPRPRTRARSRRGSSRGARPSSL